MYLEKCQERRLILASKSASRQAMLRGAGLTFEAIPADIDETSILAAMASSSFSIPEMAESLAIAKAKTVAERVRDSAAIIIGSDQILDLDGAALEAPNNRAEAIARLRALRGKSHRLVSSAAVFIGEKHQEVCTAGVEVHMRSFSEAELSVYVERVQESDLFTVGSYAFEGLGARLIDRLEGDWFTALGMPLWPLLSILRSISNKGAP